jgi:ribosomal-protein-alanine N-acetyltransferase
MLELTTERLCLRAISAADLPDVCALSADARVMQSLGGTLNQPQSEAWLERQLAHWREHGFGRFRVTRDARFVGFVGLTRTDFDRGLVPGVEIAWRLAFADWGQGYATEAARAAIEHGFSTLQLAEVIGVTSVGNTRSRQVMTRLGMIHSPAETFEHPALAAGDPRRTHVVYRLRRAAR